MYSTLKLNSFNLLKIEIDYNYNLLNIIESEICDLLNNKITLKMAYNK